MKSFTSPVSKSARGLVGFVVLASVVAACGSSTASMLSLAATSGSRTNFDSVAGKDGESAWIPAQNVVYDVSGNLPPLPDSADAFAISSPTATVKMFETLAEQFNVTTTPQVVTKSSGDFSAINISGSTADGGAYLSLTSDGSTTGWYFSDSSAWGDATWGCARSEPSGGNGGTPPDTECKSEVPPPTPNLPTEAEAKAAATALFSRLGLSVGGARIEFSADDYTATVFAVETVDSMDVPLQWTASFGENGVLLSASGVFVTIERAGSYSLISPQDAVKRLTNLVYAGRPAYMAEDSAIEQATSSGAVVGGAPVDGEPVTITVSITDVKASLMQVWLTDGKSMLLPAYTYSNPDGIVGQVVAVEDKYITVPSTSETTSPPPPESTTPGTGTLDDTIPTLAPLAQSEIDVLIGLSEEEARKVATGRGWGFRVASRDGVSFPLTADFSPTRVNVSVIADEVTRVTVG